MSFYVQDMDENENKENIHMRNKEKNRSGRDEKSHNEERDTDCFELFCAQAGYRRLSEFREYGGSLPCIPPPSPQLPRIETSSSPHSPSCSPDISKGHLTVPGLPGMRRTHSDCGPEGGILGMRVTPPVNRQKSTPMRIWSSFKNLVDSCDGSPHCLSPSTSSPPFERLEQGDMDDRCSSAPHSRHGSVKRRKRPPVTRSSRVTSNTLDLDDGSPQYQIHNFSRKNNLQRPTELQLNSLSGSGDQLHVDDCERVRHFVITPKGIVNCGDSFRSKSCSSSLRSLGSFGSVHNEPSQDSGGSQESQDGPPKYKVLIMGAAGVGKTTLAQQFLTSECLVEKENLYEYEDCNAVSVQLNGEEANLEILEQQNDNKEDFSTMPIVDATLVVYSTVDRQSYHLANSILYNLRREHRDESVILVANKTDLVRMRQVAEQEGKNAAATYDCKYFEVSALINLRVDELLGGIISQIRLHTRSHRTMIPDGRKSPMRLINKILKRQDPVSKSCDNLLVL